MKWIAFIILPIIMFVLAGCDKSETNTPEDVIVYEEINKTIVLPGSDSITGTCYPLAFEFLEEEQSGFIPIINTHFNFLNCDGYNNIMADTLSRKVIVMDENTLISQDASWAGVQNLSLQDFAGKGEKYLGYRSCFFPEGVDQYRFGWIKIKLSSNNDTLTIISRADNRTNNKAIAAGQLE